MPAKPIIERVTETPIILDGAMGTMIYLKGIFINTCYDDLSISNPDLVRGIHEEYVHAGAEVIETNSFGANRGKLRKYGLGHRVEEINQKSAELAREAAGDDLYVAGSVGPCLSPGQEMRDRVRLEITEAFEEQTAALAGAGVDFFLLETFCSIEETKIAAAAAHAHDLPVILSVSVDSEGENALGTPIETLVDLLDDNPDIDGIGINCGIGPADAYHVLERALERTEKPFFVMPNAGVPKEVDGRMIYLTTPEYFTEYAKRYIEMGASGVGGCCGTTPEHIREAARAVKSLSRVKKHVQIAVRTPEDADVDIVPDEEKSEFARKIMSGEKVSSVELVPPKSADLSTMLDKAWTCREHGVDVINIPDGPRASSRVSPMVAAIGINENAEIEPVLHYCCRDRNLIGMQSDLLGGYVAGIANFLIVTGDPPKLGNAPEATGVFDVDSIGLVRMVSNLNRGIDIGGKRVDPPTGIFIGVGANPCSVDLDLEVERFAEKVDAGAQFAITQPVFDVKALIRFIERVEKVSDMIPLIAGVWPLVSYKNAEFMNNEVPGVEVPEVILERMRKCETKEKGIDEGIAIAREIVKEIESRVAGFQVSAPFGKVEIALEVLDKAPLPAGNGHSSRKTESFAFATEKK
jgi:homocysteine S-methyltransferase